MIHNHRDGSWDNCTKAWAPVRTIQVTSQACLELMKCSCKSIINVVPCVVRKPIGTALNFANATVSSEFISAPILYGNLLSSNYVPYQ